MDVWSKFAALIGMKGNGWLVAYLSTLGVATFIPALQLTSVANVAIIIAVQPFAAKAADCFGSKDKRAVRFNY